MLRNVFELRSNTSSYRAAFAAHRPVLITLCSCSFPLSVCGSDCCDARLSSDYISGHVFGALGVFGSPRAKKMASQDSPCLYGSITIPYFFPKNDAIPRCCCFPAGAAFFCT